MQTSNAGSEKEFGDKQRGEASMTKEGEVEGLLEVSFTDFNVVPGLATPGYVAIPCGLCKSLVASVH